MTTISPILTRLSKTSLCTFVLDLFHVMVHDKILLLVTSKIVRHMSRRSDVKVSKKLRCIKVFGAEVYQVLQAIQWHSRGDREGKVLVSYLVQTSRSD